MKEMLNTDHKDIQELKKKVNNMGAVTLDDFNSLKNQFESLDIKVQAVIKNQQNIQKDMGEIRSSPFSNMGGGSGEDGSGEP
jgi:hypothetical protein